MPIKVDEKIMAKLLDEPGVREFVGTMTQEELAWYKDLLVSQGIYAGYVKEQDKDKT